MTSYVITIGQRIQERRTELGISVEDLAACAGLKASTIYDLERGDSKSSRRLYHIAACLKVGLDWLETGRGEPLMLSEPLADYQYLRDVLIVGHAKGGTTDGYFEQLDGTGDAVAFNTKDERAYAIIVKGDSMSPRIRAGEIIVVTPSREPHPGDDVVVVTKGGQKMVKHFLYRRSGIVALGSINEQHPMITLPADEIVSMEYVAGRLPPSAVKELMHRGSKAK